MSIDKKTAKFDTGHSTLEVKLLKGDSISFANDDSNYLNLANTRTLNVPLAATVMSASDGKPLLYTRIDSQQVVSVAINTVTHNATLGAVSNRLHRHDFFELSIVAAGTVEMQIETHRIMYQVGDVITINRNTRHAEERLCNATLYTLEISKEYLRRLSEANELFSYMNETQKRFFSKNLNDEAKWNKDFIECRYLGSIDNIKLMELFSKITEEMESSAPGFSLVVQAMIYRLFSLLSDTSKYSCTYIDLGFDGGESLANTTKQLLDKTKRKMSLAEISEYLHYSSKHINRVFRKCFGRSVKDYNRMIYMQEAAQLLTFSTMSIQDIIKKVGLDNRTHFYNLFFETFQTTPAEYRRLHNSVNGK